MPAADPDINAVLGLKFEEQIAFFRRKLNLPTERWDDIWQSAHDKAFMVAGAMKADLLADLRKAVSGLQATTLEQFRKDFKAIVARHGWTGWTGEGSAAGRAWRTRVIYETNVRTSYAAGRWAQLTDPDVRAALPFWRYVHNDSVLHPRPMHLAWNGLTLPADHPFWKTHFAPNGWGCKCRIDGVRRPAQGDATTPPEGWDAIDPQTGAPPGIDRGWGYAPGSRADDSLRSFVQDKLITLPQAISMALTRDVNRWITAHADIDDFVRQALAERQTVQDLWLGFAGDNPRLNELAGHDVSDYLVLMPSDAPRHIADEHGHDAGGQRPPEPKDYASAARWLADGLLSPGDDGKNGLKRIKARYESGAERIDSIWELRPGKRNRALALISMWVKV